MSAPKVRRIKADPHLEARKALRTILRSAADEPLPMTAADLRASLAAYKPSHVLSREAVLRLLTDEVKEGRVRAETIGWRWIQQAAVAELEPPTATGDEPRVEYQVYAGVIARLVNPLGEDVYSDVHLTERVFIRPAEPSEDAEFDPLLEGVLRAQIAASEDLTRRVGDLIDAKR